MKILADQPKMSSVLPPGFKTRRIPPQEWIQDYFSPILGVLSCDTTETLCRKNNLTFVELLQPFSKLLTDVTVKDPEGVNHSISNLNLIFQDFRRDPSRLVNSKLMYDIVAEITEEPVVTKAFNRGEDFLEAPGFTPWFDAYMKLYLQSIPALEHEFVRNHLGVIFGVAANNPNPLETFRNLTQIQQKQQQDNRSTAYPQYLSANILKYYVLVHDVYETDESVAHEIFTAMQQAFGSHFCHLLQINSRTQQPLKNDEVTASVTPSGGNPGVAEHWFTAASHRFCNVETRLFVTTSTLPNNVTSTPPTLTPVLSTKGVTSNDTTSTKSDDLIHPLAIDEKPESPTFEVTSTVPKLTRVDLTNIALHLTPNDVDRIRIFVREFCIRGLIPHVERQMRMFNDIVTNRKSRSLFSGAKRWFGQAKPGTASGTSVIYGKEAPELQIRKLGDLFFMLKLYKQAYNCYHTAKKDFQSDEAWNYYAGAAEMAALAQFMQNDALKKYPAHYMEDSIAKYLQVCQLPEFAVRATLFDALCLKYHGQFIESASSYIRITNETKDLRSALLLEQAAYCYLLSQPALIRKYAFHIILAGFRFSKCGQKKHSARSYKQGFQIYKGRGWSLSEDHILYTLGHQSLLLKDHSVATGLFNDLLAMTSPGINPLQQMCHLREFFIVHHMREKEEKKAEVVTIPRIHSQQIVLDLSGQGQSYEQLVDANAGSSWQTLERIVCEQIRFIDSFIPLSTKTCQAVFSPVSNNTVKPTAISGERVRILLPIENPFQTPFVLRKVNLLWKFTKSDETVYSNDAKIVDKDAENCVKAETIDNVTVDKNGRVVLDLGLVVVATEGELDILGVAYSIRAQFPQSESTDYSIRGKQYFSVRGPRLNATKDHKTTVTYAKDFRLQLVVSPPMPKLDVKVSGFPENLFQGEVRNINLELTNGGGSALCQLHLVQHQPGTIALPSGSRKDRRKTLFPFPVITDTALRHVSDNGMAKEIPVDILPTDVRLDPGQTMTTSIWLRAPETLGTHSIAVYFYYEALAASENSRIHHYRMLKLNFVIKVAALVSVNAVRNRPCLHDNDLCQTVVVSVNNTSTAVHTQHQIYVSQLSLLSHSSVIRSLLSANENAVVQKGESINFGLQTSAGSEGNVEAGISGLHESSVQTKGGKVFGADHPPFVDFVKPSFTFNGRKKEPTLSRDIIVVVWRVAGGASAPASPQIGLVFVPLKDDTGVATTTTNDFDVLDNNVTDGASTTDSMDISLPLPKRPCHVTVIVANNFSHDFKSGNPLLVPFQVTAENRGSLPGRLHFKADKDWRTPEGSSCKFLGCTRTSTIIAAGGKKAFQFRVLVTGPGIFNCHGLRFQFSPPEEEHPDQDELIPLEVAFVASQK